MKQRYYIIPADLVQEVTITDCNESNAKKAFALNPNTSKEDAVLLNGMYKLENKQNLEPDESKAILKKLLTLDPKLMEWLTMYRIERDM